MRLVVKDVLSVSRGECHQNRIKHSKTTTMRSEDTLGLRWNQLAKNEDERGGK